ncbi:hypothetical protein ACHAXS_002699 [Conticribra weissflogii]
MSERALPENVREVLSRLVAKDQVVLRAYIAGLRDQLNEYKVKAECNDDDPHAHYHGHEKCTHDHGHHHNHGKSEDDNQEKVGSSHGHKPEHNNNDGHDHTHEHKHEHEHDHGHGHDPKMEEGEKVPAWKRRALEKGNDPNTAPFGGSWNTESSIDATK